MLKFSLLFTFLICWAISVNIWAHPVSYEGSLPVTFNSAPRMSEIQAVYSLKYWFALGAHSFFLRQGSGDRYASYAKANLLAKRWNLTDAQGNLYLWGGVGSWWQDGAVPSYLTGGQVDFETQRLFLSSLIQHAWNQNRGDFQTIKGRVGVAPYVADFDEVQTWFMVR
ncbi:MAG: hypothetical protein R3A11_06440 [Bdellovibrionota bacterium]